MLSILTSLAHALVAATAAYGHVCASDLARVQRSTPAVAAEFVGQVGISEGELRSLLTRREVLPGDKWDLRLWPRLVAGRPALVNLQRRRPSIIADESDAKIQLKRAGEDAWIRTVAELLAERFDSPRFKTTVYAGFIRNLMIDFEDFAPYSPSATKIRIAVARSLIPKSGQTEVARLRTLTKLIGVAMPADAHESNAFTRELQDKMGNLPSAGGAVVDLLPSVFERIQWSERAEPFLRRLTIEDVGRVTPGSVAGREFLDRLSGDGL